MELYCLIGLNHSGDTNYLMEKENSGCTKKGFGLKKYDILAWFRPRNNIQQYFTLILTYI